jgi:hypothetical protein
MINLRFPKFTQTLIVYVLVLVFLVLNLLTTHILSSYCFWILCWSLKHFSYFEVTYIEEEEEEKKKRMCTGITCFMKRSLGLIRRQDHWGFEAIAESMYDFHLIWLSVGWSHLLVPGIVSLITVNVHWIMLIIFVEWSMICWYYDFPGLVEANKSVLWVFEEMFWDTNIRE